MYAHAPEEALARSLRITIKTLRAWRSGASPVPWWVPELLRLRQVEFDRLMRSAGYRRMGIVRAGQSAQVYRFAPIVANTPPAPVSAISEELLRA